MVAIAITLIVLPLVDTARDLGGESVTEFLQHNVANLAAAALSFVVIGSFWKDHHRRFEQVTGYSKAVVNLNLVWLVSMMAMRLQTSVVQRQGLLHPDASVRSVPTWELWLPAELVLLAFVLAAFVPGLRVRALFVVLAVLPVEWVQRLRGKKSWSQAARWIDDPTIEGDADQMQKALVACPRPGPCFGVSNGT